MKYKALYRKYRPDCFDMVYGQKSITETLKKIIIKNKICHAYLFTGPRGTGKTTCAKLFAKIINCNNPQNGDCCNECDNCKSFINNSNPDIIEIDAASNNGVDEIRELKNKVNLVPSFSKYKVYIIDEVHMLSSGAFNALLKTLEEPPEHVIFILATTDPQKMPATVISRCQRFDFKNIVSSEMIKCLKNIAIKENIRINDDALDEIVINASGGMRDAIGLLDQSSILSDEKVTLDTVEMLSGSISNSDAKEIIENIVLKNNEYIIKKSSQLEENGKSYLFVIEKCLYFLRNSYIDYKLNENNILNINGDKYIYLIMELEKLYYLLSKSNHKNLVFDINMLKIISDFENDNVSRETLNKKTVIKEGDVSRETSKKDQIKEKSNVSRETLLDKKTVSNEETYNTLKKIRINNILLEAKKQNLLTAKEKWSKLKLLILEKNRTNDTGILLNCNPIAASDNGIIICSKTDIELKKIEKKYDECREIINELLEKKNKVVFITDDYWNEERPIYIKKIRNKELSFIDEQSELEIVKNKNKDSTTDFKEFVEVEE